MSLSIRQLTQPSTQSQSAEAAFSVAEVSSLLTACGLPVADIRADAARHFFGVRSDGSLVAVVGLELYPPCGLLRSLAVAPARRGRGLARGLVAYAESYAAARHVETLFLLTTDSAEFFLRLGYLPLSRANAPSAIQATAQFSGLCPATSALLSKNIRAALPGT